MSKATTTVVMLLMAIMALACGNDHNLDQRISAPYPSARELAKSAQREWDKNPAYYEINHQGHTATFHDRVAALTPSSASFGHHLWIVVPTWIRCEFESKQELATLQRGNKVTVSGILGLVKRHLLHMEKCRLMPDAEPQQAIN